MYDEENIEGGEEELGLDDESIDEELGTADLGLDDDEEEDPDNRFS